jgi:hypothetical protein
LDRKGSKDVPGLISMSCAFKGLSSASPASLLNGVSLNPAKLVFQSGPSTSPGIPPDPNSLVADIYSSFGNELSITPLALPLPVKDSRSDKDEEVGVDLEDEYSDGS